MYKDAHVIASVAVDLDIMSILTCVLTTVMSAGNFVRGFGRVGKYKFFSVRFWWLRVAFVTFLSWVELKHVDGERHGGVRDESQIESERAV